MSIVSADEWDHLQDKVAVLEARVQELLEANNREVERRREAERKVEELLEIRSHGYVINLKAWRTQFRFILTGGALDLMEEFILKLDQVAVDIERRGYGG